MADSTITIFRNAFPNSANKGVVLSYIVGYLLLLTLPAINALAGLPGGISLTLISFVPGLVVMIAAASKYFGNNEVTHNIGAALLASITCFLLLLLVRKVFLFLLWLISL